jgi:hypothetical protein
LSLKTGEDGGCMQFSQLFDKLVERPTVRKFYGRVPGERVLEPGFQVQAFTPGDAYFRVRIAEMFLRNRGELLRDFVPLAMVASEFYYDGERRSVPFVVSNQILDEALRNPVENEVVELFNTTVAGPIPYLSDRVGLFVGLFRTEVNDLAGGLFGLISNLATAFNAGQLTAYLKIGDVLQAGIRDILGMKSVEFCFGQRDEFGSGSGSSAPFESGYLLFVNGSESEVAGDRLWVKEGRLFQGERETTVKRYVEHDYCLLAIDHLPQRNDEVELGFHRIWEETQDLIWAGNLEQARLFGLSRLAKAVVKSPDLIDRDKTDLLETYKGNFEAEVSRYRMIHEPAVTRNATRGGDAPGLVGAAMIQKMAVVAEKRRAEQVATSMRQLAGRYEALYQPGGEQRVVLDQGRMKAQLAALRATDGRTRPDSATLAELMVEDSIDTLEKGLG